MACLLSCRSASVGAPHPSTATSQRPQCDTLRYIIYDDGAEARQRLLRLAAPRGDRGIYQYTHFQAIAVAIGSCANREQAVKVYTKPRGVLQMVEDGVMNLD